MKRLLVGILVLVLALVVVAAGALMLVDVNHFRPQIQTTLGKALGRQVTLGRLHMSLWSGSLEADDIRIGDAPGFGGQAFVSARSLALGVRLWPLLVHRELRVTSLTLDAPSVRLLQDAHGRWNFSDFGGPGAPPAKAPQGTGAAPAFSVDHLRIHDGSIILKRAAGDSRRYSHVELSADHVGTGSAFPFSLAADIAGGGSLKLDGQIGPWRAGNAVQTPLQAHLVIRGLNLVAAGLMNAQGGVGGVIDLDSRIQSRQGVLRSQGHIGAQHLKLVASGSPAPQPVQVDYQAAYRLDRGTGTISHSTLGTGKARLDAAGSFDNRGKVMRLDLHLQGKGLPVDDLQPLLPAFGVVLPKNSHLSGGTLTLSLHAHGALDALVIEGPVALDGTRLAGYSLGAKLGGALSLAGIQAPQDTTIKHAAATLRISPAGITADPAEADITGVGTLTGKGHMAADGKLDFRMLVKLDKGITGAGGSKGLSGLLGGSKAGRLLGGVIRGTTSNGIGVRVEGTASDPHFRLDPAAMRELLKSGLGGSAAPGARTPSTAQGSSPLDSLLQRALKKSGG